MSDLTSRPDMSLDRRWLANQHRHMVADLAAALDLEAGLTEAMIPARHANLVVDLSSVLNVEAGLRAIVSDTPDPTAREPELTGSLHSVNGAPPAVVDTRHETDPQQALSASPSLTNLDWLAHAGWRTNPRTCLAMRNATGPGHSGRRRKLQVSAFLLLFLLGIGIGVYDFIPTHITNIKDNSVMASPPVPAPLDGSAATAQHGEVRDTGQQSVPEATAQHHELGDTGQQSVPPAPSNPAHHNAPPAPSNPVHQSAPPAPSNPAHQNAPPAPWNPAQQGEVTAGAGATGGSGATWRHDGSASLRHPPEVLSANSSCSGAGDSITITATVESVEKSYSGQLWWIPSGSTKGSWIPMNRNTDGTLSVTVNSGRGEWQVWVKDTEGQGHGQLKSIDCAHGE
jgi:hypothetical protein